MAKNDYIEIMEKNHMEIPWHDYTENDSEVLIQQAGLIEKGIGCRPGWSDYAFLWNRSMACADFYEQAFQGTWSNLYSGCGTDVHRV